MSVQRPTSPHLTIYKPQITSVLSITHRLTGVALVVGVAPLVAWLWSAAYAPQYYAQLYTCLSSWPGQITLFGWTFAFYYHLANGIRHLYWDTGRGLEIHKVSVSGWTVVLFTLLMTLLTWGFIRGEVSL